MKTSTAFKVALALLAVAVLLSFMGLFVPIEVVLTLAFGWPIYLAEVVPEVRVDPAGLATGAVCLVGFAAGSHAFLAWLYGAVRAPEPARWRKKWTAQLVSGVVLMFTAGLAAAGVAHQVGWLVRSPERLVSPPSKIVWRMQSVNNLRMILLGCANFMSAKGTYPPGATAADRGVFLHSWQTLILPYVDEGPSAFNAIDLARPWDDPANAGAFRQVQYGYLIPGVTVTRDAGGRGLSHYEGNIRVVGGFRGLTDLDVPDGTSNTILGGESAGGYRPWGEPGHWRDLADGINRAPDRGFGGPFPGGANFMFLDGSVRFLKNSIDPRVLKALGTPAGGESIPSDAY